MMVTLQGCVQVTAVAGNGDYMLVGVMRSRQPLGKLASLPRHHMLMPIYGCFAGKQEFQHTLTPYTIH
jgi:hypothetical protein